MPDFERLTDGLEADLAERDPHRSAWLSGFRAGKKQARIEILFLISIISIFAFYPIAVELILQLPLSKDCGDA